MPGESRLAVERAMSDYKIKSEAARCSPAIVTRAKVAAMFAKANAHKNYPGEYYNLLHTAEAALVEWMSDYPAEAATEKSGELIAEAEKLEASAVDALVYDADGLLDNAEQKKRHDCFMFRAKKCRRLANEVSILQQGK